MSLDKSGRQNRVREALGRIYDQHPPYFREYLRRFKEDPTSRVFAPLAEAYRRLGRLDEAIDICREGLEHHPDFHGGRVALAKCFIDKKQYSEARAELEKVVQFVPENLLAQRLLGDVLSALGDRPGALHCYKMALLLSPNDVALAERVHALEKEVELGSYAPPPAEKLFQEVTEETGVVTDETVEKISLLTEDGDLPPLWNEPAAPAAEPDATPVAEEINVKMDEADLESILGDEDADEEDEPFRIEHVSEIFVEQAPKNKQEITTETLGDLYYSQGQYDRSLRIFEKLEERRPSPELSHKINACRVKLGVNRDQILRDRRIEVLRGVLKTVKDE